MSNVRNNPESEENIEMTRQNSREIFALQMMARAAAGEFENKEEEEE